MYRNVEHALREVYKIANVRIEPKNNTGQICEWLESKGSNGGNSGTGLSQHDWHANSAMIQLRIERTLSEIELKVIEAEYGANLSNIVDVTKYITDMHPEIDMRLCDAILEHLWGNVKPTAIMDRFDLHERKFYRRRNKIKDIVTGISTQAKLKLEDVFIQDGTISREWVA